MSLCPSPLTYGGSANDAEAEARVWSDGVAPTVVSSGVTVAMIFIFYRSLCKTLTLVIPKPK